MNIANSSLFQINEDFILCETKKKQTQKKNLLKESFSHQQTKPDKYKNIDAKLMRLSLHVVTSCGFNCK